MPIPGDNLKAGWGVIRMTPWHLTGIFTSSVDAEILAQRLGRGYAVKYGDHVVGSPDFAFTERPTPKRIIAAFTKNRADLSNRKTDIGA